MGAFIYWYVCIWALCVGTLNSYIVRSLSSLMPNIYGLKVSYNVKCDSNPAESSVNYISIEPQGVANPYSYANGPALSLMVQYVSG